MIIRQSTEDQILAEFKEGGRSMKEFGCCLDCNTRGIYRAIGVLERGGCGIIGKIGSFIRQGRD